MIELTGDVRFTGGVAAPRAAPQITLGPFEGSITTSGVVITWTTDVPCTSQVNYSTDHSYGTQTTKDTNLVLSHSVTITGLTDNTQYFYKASSDDGFAQNVLSAEDNWTTLATGGGNSPLLSTVDTTYPDTSGYTSVSVCASGCTYTTLAAALTAQQNNCGSTGVLITMKAGETFSTSTAETLPVNDCTGGTGATRKMIVIASDSLASLPAAGTRLDPSLYYQFLPRLITTGTNQPRIKMASGAGHYYLVGLELAGTNTTAGAGALFYMGIDPLTSSAAQAQDTIIDRSYIHGVANKSNMSVGVNMRPNGGAVINCHISDLYQGQGAETHGIAFDLGTGPAKIYNNFIMGQTELILTGGSSPGPMNIISSIANSGAMRTSNVATIKHNNANSFSSGNSVRIKNCSDTSFNGDYTITVDSSTQFHYTNGTGLPDVGAATAGAGQAIKLPICENCIPSDLDIEKNHGYRAPEKWPFHANYDHLANSCAKNGFELKIGKRVYFRGNVVENIYEDCGQHGYGFLITPFTSSIVGGAGAMDWSVVQDVVYEYNWVKHALMFSFLSRWNGTGASQDIPPYPNRAINITYLNNLGTDLSRTNWANPTGSPVFKSFALGMQGGGNVTGYPNVRGPEPFNFSNNTMLSQDYGYETSGNNSVHSTPGAVNSFVGYNYFGKLANNGFGADNPSVSDGNNSINAMLDMVTYPNSFGKSVFTGKTCANYSTYYTNCGTTDAKFFPADNTDLKCHPNCATETTITNFALTNGNALATACNAGPCGADIATLATEVSGTVQPLANIHTVSSISPSSIVCNGTNTITVTGTNFVSQEAACIIGPDGKTATVAYVNATTLTVTPPGTLTVGSKNLWIRQFGLGQNDTFAGTGSVPVTFTCS